MSCHIQEELKTATEDEAGARKEAESCEELYKAAKGEATHLHEGRGRKRSTPGVNAAEPTTLGSDLQTPPPRNVRHRNNRQTS